MFHLLSTCLLKKFSLLFNMNHNFYCWSYEKIWNWLWIWKIFTITIEIEFGFNPDWNGHAITFLCNILHVHNLRNEEGSVKVRRNATFFDESKISDKCSLLRSSRSKQPFHIQCNYWVGRKCLHWKLVGSFFVLEFSVERKH